MLKKLITVNVFRTPACPATPNTFVKVAYLELLFPIPCRLKLQSFPAGSHCICQHWISAWGLSLRQSRSTGTAPLPRPPLQYHSSQLKPVCFALAVTWMLHMLQCNERTIPAIRLLLWCWFFIKMCLTFFQQHYCYNIFYVLWFYKSALHYTEEEVYLVLNPYIKHSVWTMDLRDLVCYSTRYFNKSAS